MNDRDERGGTLPPGRAPRRPYQRPKLERLGTLTEITAAVTNTGKKNDHGARPFTKS